MPAPNPLTLREAQLLMLFQKKNYLNIPVRDTSLRLPPVRMILPDDVAEMELIGDRIGFHSFQFDGDGIFVDTGSVRQLFLAAKKICEEEGRQQAELGQHTRDKEAATASKSCDKTGQSSESVAKLLDDTNHQLGDGIVWMLADPATLRSALDCEAAGMLAHAARRALLERLLKYNEKLLPVATHAHLERLQGLRQDFPNFSAVIDLVENHLSLLVLTRSALSLPPLMLLGPPGVGKTFFVSTLAERLGMKMELRSIAETSAGWILNGTHEGWRNGQVGAVAKLAIDTDPGSVPLLLIDEIDKSNAGNYSPEHALLGVLEPSTARRFRDEFLNIEIDVSPMAFVATANKEPLPDSPLASRFTVVRVRAPDKGQMPRIVRSVDRALRSERPALDATFLPLSDDTVDAIASASPRDLRQRLLRMYASAAQEFLKQSTPEITEGSDTRIDVAAGQKSVTDRDNSLADEPDAREQTSRSARAKVH